MGVSLVTHAERGTEYEGVREEGAENVILV